MKKFAKQLTAQAGDGFPFIFTDLPYTLQFYLNTMSPRLAYAKAAQYLTGPEAAYVIVSDPADFKAHAPALTTATIHQVAVQSRKHKPGLVVLSNRPKLEYSDQMVSRVGPIVVQTNGGTLHNLHERDCDFRPTKAGASITVKNDSPAARRFSVRVMKDGKPAVEQRTLSPSEIWGLRVPAIQPPDATPHPRTGPEQERASETRRSPLLIALLFTAIALILTAGCRHTLRSLQSTSRW